MASIAIWVSLEVILVLWFGLPECASWLDLGDYFPWPKSCCIDISNCLYCCLLLFVGHVVNR